MRASPHTHLCECSDGCCLYRSSVCCVWMKLDFISSWTSSPFSVPTPPPVKSQLGTAWWFPHKKTSTNFLPSIRSRKERLWNAVLARTGAGRLPAPTLGSCKRVCRRPGGRRSCSAPCSFQPFKTGLIINPQGNAGEGWFRCRGNTCPDRLLPARTSTEVRAMPAQVQNPQSLARGTYSIL